MSFIFDGKKIKIGTCYYPEHWPKSMWSDDLDRMLDAGIEVIRIAEFAWSKVELREGEFNYDFFDEFLDLCEEKGMKVIFCTPTATPPAWLTEKYPEVLNADINGVKFRHGSRRHYNYNSEIYREKASIITEKFASHYAKRNCIIGWQLDNELNCEIGVFYSESDSNAFRLWLLNKYHDLDVLNDAWGTNFWNQTYTSWDEIYVPRPTCNKAQNPHEMLDYFRFISESCRGFARLQSEIIRKYKKPEDFITTNGMFGHLDNHALCKESLDVYMYDSYPNFTNRVGRKVDAEALEDRWWSRNLSETRSVSKIFGIMEQQSGANGWNIWPGVPNPRPGQITLWTIQSIAHGADYVSFFRWRTAVYGTEMYWHGILDYSSRTNERLEEVKKIGSLVKSLNTVAGKEYEAEVAILRDYDNNFDAEIDTWHGSIDAVSQNAMFEALQRTHTPFDYVYFFDGGISNDLNRYKVIFWPHPIIASEERAKALMEYVKAGGTLILGARSGQKDLNGRCVMDILPGVFRDLSGADVKEYSFIQPDNENVEISFKEGNIKAEMFVDRLSEKSQGEVLATFANEYFEGDVAVTVKKCGKGKVYYYGSALNEGAVKYFLEATNTASPLEKTVSAPWSVEIAKRGDCIFLLNYKKAPATVCFNKTVTDVLTKKTYEGDFEIPEYGFLIVKEV